VAAGFNKFFTSVASDLVSKLPNPLRLFTPGSSNFVSFYRSMGIYGTRMTLSLVSSHFVRKQLIGLNPGKITGLDGLSPRFLRDGAEYLGEPVSHMINMSISTETVPRGFRQARATPLYKKGSRLDPGNYIPISVLSVMSTILERAVHGQLSAYLSERGLLYEYQSGFRGKYSTDTCLINLTDYIRSELSQGKLVGMALIDLRKAFDTVDHGLLCEKLEVMGVGSLGWFRSYLGERVGALE
jgi:hypothetical protein